MDLSVIIVNYNVKYFLEQCLHSVLKASDKANPEIIVVDNNSTDGSVQMVREKFPHVKLITNTVNLGFAKANNQAIRVSGKRYILLLNPDTLIQEDSLDKCLTYMESHPEAGCLGVKMIDGKGNYLPESKRGLPTPWVAFYKISGISSLFPHSRKFGRYHLGFLDRETVNEVDVISGAFMFLRRETLEKTGLLDEDFFMYGEDIDISYRISQAGYKNVYFPLTTIIHYKGESTKKGSINYVLVFYRAMIIFARKHFNQSTFRLYSLFINAAIYLRAAVSIFYRFLASAITPVADVLFIYIGFLVLTPLWEKYHFGFPGYYPSAYLEKMVPGYIVIWVFSIFLTTGYERKVKLNDLIRGIFYGSLVILICYALLPETWRFSRALIIIGTFWVLGATILNRYLLSIVKSKFFSFEIGKKTKRIIIVGHYKESTRVYSIIKQAHIEPDLIGFVSPSASESGVDFIGHIDQIEEIARINDPDELIFCSSDMTSEQIIRTMLKFTNKRLEFKIAAPESLSVIGSNSNTTAGELYILHFNTLSRTVNKRKKRLFDLLFSLLLIPALPVLLLVVKKPGRFLTNIFNVMAGRNSWVGYYATIGGEHPGLPLIKPGILTPVQIRDNVIPGKNYIEQKNLLYAKDYHIKNDLFILLQDIKELGRNPVQHIN